MADNAVSPDSTAVSSPGNSRSDPPLADLRVLEMGVLLAGPFCGQLLADFGAEVIKIEQPGTGDPMREWGREHSGGQSLWWPVVARNKKSVTLNLRKAEGQALIRRLIESTDIIVENFRPGTLERWGLSYDEIRAVNPRTILVRVTGFGQDGPYATQPGYGSIGEAMGGLRYVVGDPSTPPSRMGISIGDTLAATFACLGALAALHNRERTGRGQVVDSAIYEAVLAVMESLIPEYATHYIGAGGVVINSRDELLVVSELHRRSESPHYKLPGGALHPGEHIADCVQREVFEETGVRAKFEKLVCFRHWHGYRYDKSDIYFVCRLSPLTEDIAIQAEEIEECHWLPISEYLSSDSVSTFNKHIVKAALESPGVVHTEIAGYSDPKRHEIFMPNGMAV